MALALEQTGIGNKGDLEQERIGLIAKRDLQLKYYMIFTTTSTEGGFYNRSQNAYWFTPQEIKAGDKVVLYSRAGQDSIKENQDGSKTYFYYWGLSTALFTQPAKRIVLVEINSWQLSTDL